MLREGSSANGLQTAAQQADILSYHTNHYKEDPRSSGMAPKVRHELVKCGECGLFKPKVRPTANQAECRSTQVAERAECGLDAAHACAQRS